MTGTSICFYLLYVSHDCETFVFLQTWTSQFENKSKEENTWASNRTIKKKGSEEISQWRVSCILFTAVGIMEVEAMGNVKVKTISVT